LAGFEFGADDSGEVAHILRDEEVGLHEALDARQPAAALVANALGDEALQVEGQALLGAAGHEMHVAAHAPQELLAAREKPELLRREEAGLHELFRLAHPVDVFRDPEEGVEVAQASLAVLHVRLDEVARGTGLVDARVALFELRIHELGRGGLHHLLVEAGDELLVEGVSPNRKRASSKAVRIVMSARASRMHSSTERVAWPTFSFRSQST
jgi:hypothetical protein